MSAAAQQPVARRGWTLALTATASFMGALDVLVVAVALPSIHRDLGGTVSTLEWTVNAYNLSLAAGIVTAAALGDRIGRRRLFSMGLAMFALASAACALAPSLGWLIAARAVQGAGAAITAPLSLTILVSAFPAERRAAVIGAFGAIAGLAVASGPLLGGAITGGLDWHWIFWVNVPVGLAAALLARYRLIESRGPKRELDIGGAVLVTALALALVWALVRSGSSGWGIPEIGAALLGLLLLITFACWERRAVDPILPPRLFRNRSFVAANASGFLMIGSLMSAVFLIAQFFQFVRHDSPLLTGLLFLPWTGTPMLVAPAAGALADRIGARPVMVAGLVLQAFGLGWFALVANDQTAYASLVAPFVIAGVGVSMAIPTTTASALGAVSPADTGNASGVNRTLQQFGAVTGIAVATAIFSAAGSLTSPARFDAGFTPALATAAAMSLLAALAARSVGRRADVGVEVAGAIVQPADA